MKIHKVTLIAILIVICAFSITTRSEELDGAPEGFAKLYLTTCMQNINDFEALRTRLINNKLPKFPPEQATLFLQGQSGDAWPVPHQGQMGNFVLTLPIDKSFCAIHVRRANQTEVEQLFIRLVAKAPSPLVSERRKDEQSETTVNGKTRIISYTWSLPQANRKMLFMLTTASSENAQLQVLGSASMISE